MADRIIYNLDRQRRYLQGELEDLLRPTPASRRRSWPSKALGLVQKLDPPGVGARDLRECLLLQLTPGMPYYERTPDADLRPPGGPRAQPPARDRAATGYSIELIQQALEELRKLNPNPGADFSDAWSRR